jgi:hypothetical protein
MKLIFRIRLHRKVFAKIKIEYGTVIPTSVEQVHKFVLHVVSECNITPSESFASIAEKISETLHSLLRRPITVTVWEYDVYGVEVQSG